MIKISQLPDAVGNNGDEIIPIVQEGQTRKAKAIFTDSENKVVLSDGAELKIRTGDTSISLLKAKVVDGVTTVIVGQDNIGLFNGNRLIVTEPLMSDGMAYVRVNNAWVKRSPITDVNGKTPVASGGSITLTNIDVKAHTENSNRDGIEYVSRDGAWIKLATALTVPLQGKANLVHSHAISDVDNLTGQLDQLNSSVTDKANKIHTHAISDITGLEERLAALEAK